MYECAILFTFLYLGNTLPCSVDIPATEQGNLSSTEEGCKYYSVKWFWFKISKKRWDEEDCLSKSITGIILMLYYWLHAFATAVISTTSMNSYSTTGKHVRNNHMFICIHTYIHTIFCWIGHILRPQWISHCLFSESTCIVTNKMGKITWHVCSDFNDGIHIVSVAYSYIH